MSKKAKQPSEISFDKYDKDFLQNQPTIKVGPEYNLKLEETSPEGVLLRYWITRNSLVKEAKLRRVIIEALVGDEWSDIYKY